MKQSKEATDIPNRGRMLFAKFKPFLNGLANFYKVFPVGFRVKLLDFHRYTKGKIGMGIRYSLVKSLAASCGDNIAIFEGVF